MPLSKTPRRDMSAPSSLRRRVGSDMEEFLTPEFQAAFEKLKLSLEQTQRHQQLHQQQRQHTDDCNCEPDDADVDSLNSESTRCEQVRTRSIALDRQIESNMRDRGVTRSAYASSPDNTEANCGNPELCVYCSTVAELAQRLLFALRGLQLLLFTFRVLSGYRSGWLYWFVNNALFFGFFIEEGLRMFKFGRTAYYTSVWNRLYNAMWSADARFLVGLVAIIVSSKRTV